MQQKLFSITCLTCHARLAVFGQEVIGDIVACPRCGSMVQVAPPSGWQPPRPPETAADGSPPDQPQAFSIADGDSSLAAGGPGLKWSFFAAWPTWCWIAAAPLVTTAICAAVWFAAFSGGGVQNAPSSTADQSNPALVAASQQYASTEPTDELAAERTQSRDNEPATAAQPSVNEKQAGEPDKENSRSVKAEKSAQPSETTAAEQKTSEAKPADANAGNTSPSASKTAEANSAEDLKKQPTKIAPAQDDQPVPSAKALRKVVKLVPPDQYSLQSLLDNVVPAVDFRGMPFGQAIDLLSTLGRFPITLDPDAMIRLGVSLAIRLPSS